MYATYTLNIVHTKTYEFYRIWDGVHNQVACRMCREHYLILGITVTSSGMILVCLTQSGLFI